MFDFTRSEILDELRADNERAEAHWKQVYKWRAEQEERNMETIANYLTEQEMEERHIEGQFRITVMGGSGTQEQWFPAAWTKRRCQLPFAKKPPR